MIQETLTIRKDGKIPIHPDLVYISQNAFTVNHGYHKFVMVFSSIKRDKIVDTFRSIADFEKKYEYEEED